MRIRAGVISVLVVVLTAATAMAQDWSFDARDIAMGGVGTTGNLSTKMIVEQRDYTPIVLPFGLIQVFKDVNIFNPDSSSFDPVRAIEYAASPVHYGLDRGRTNTGEALFVSDLRNATLSRDLSRYRGFIPANDLLAEGLVAPNFGGTIKLVKGARGSFQGVYVGGGPYLSVHSSSQFAPALTGVLTTGVNVPNALFPIANTNEGQLALAITGGYRGRFAWASGIGSGSDREGLYVAANYNYLHGFQYENDAMAITLRTAADGLLIDASNIVLDHQHATDGRGFSIDVGVGAVVNRWEVGFGASGLGNRIDWNGLSQTRYTLQSLTSGNSDFVNSPTITAGSIRVVLPVDYRGNVAYYSDSWSAAGEVGHGFGGTSLHAGLERRVGRMEVRGGARYSFNRWNPTGGVGFDLSRRIALDVAAYGTSANIERTRHTAIAVSIRFNHLNKKSSTPDPDRSAAGQPGDSK
jgi:hypothetical protein